jgi:transcriptional regulator with XRE-family HTH domain
MLYTIYVLRHLRITIGHNIHCRRARRKMPLQKFAAETGVPVLKIDHYELGKNEITLDHALRIACARGIPFEELMK